MKTAEELFKEISNAGDLTNEDLEKLHEMLKTAAFRRFLCSLLRESDAMGGVLLSCDLSTDIGVKNAIAYQGKARGLSEAVGILIDLMTKAEYIKDDLKEEENNGPRTNDTSTSRTNQSADDFDSSSIES